MNVTLARSYEPFGDPLMTTGTSYSIYGFSGEQRDGTGLIYLRARYYGPAFGRFLSRDPWEGDPNQPMSYNVWLYVYANPVNYRDPMGMFVCSPTPACQAWLIHALARLDVSGGTFSRLAAGLFWAMDERSGWHRMRVDFVTPGWGFAAIPYQIYLPASFMRDSLPPPVRNVAFFVHETIHQTQTIGERASIWGEAQAFIFEAKVVEELGGDLSPHLKEIPDIAFDLQSRGFTTTDRQRLEQVRRVLRSTFGPHWLYDNEPLLPSDSILAYIDC